MDHPDEMRDLFIEAVGNLGESLGLNRTVCQIYALLYLSPEPLSPTQIGEALKISKGNVSINIRKLIEWNAVKKVWRKGNARRLFCANDNVWEIVLKKLKLGIEKRTEEFRSYLKLIQEHTGRRCAAGHLKRKEDLDMNFFLKKTEQIRALLGQVEYILSHLSSLDSFLSTKQ